MSTRESLLREIEKQPEPVLKELQQYLVYLKGTSELSSRPREDDWPSGYFERTAGAFANEPLERPAQGDYEKREGW